MGEFNFQAPKPRGDGDTEIEGMLDDLKHEIEIGTIYNTSRIDFIESLADWYEDHNFLTEAQESALKDIHSEVVG